MMFARFQMSSPLGNGPAGPTFLGIEENRTYEIRVCEQNVIRDEIDRRLNLLKLVKHPAARMFSSIHWHHSPPFAVFQETKPLMPLRAHESAKHAAIELIDLMQECHRVGLTFGTIGQFDLRRTSDDQFVVDLVGIAGEWHRQHPTQTTLEDDINTLVRLLTGLLEHDEITCQQNQSMFERMRDTVPENRPLIEEVAERFKANLTPVERTAEVNVPMLEGTVDSVDSVNRTANIKIAGVPQIDSLIGRFQIVSQLGQGGMGVVFRAIDTSTQKDVAIKVMKSTTAHSEISRLRFIKECRLLAKLNSPYITKLILADTEGDQSYMALEFVDGVSLGEYLAKQGTIPEPVALDFIADAARGLSVAHRLGIVHRDVKPDNLLIPANPNDGPTLKVTDFGLARMTSQTESLDVTKAGAMLGTPRYMSPEQFGGKNVDARADVYSLAATLFHMLTGFPPFPQPNLHALTRAVLDEPPPLADRLNPAISPITAAFIARCMAKRADERPANAEVFLRELERNRHGEPTKVFAHPHAPTASNPTIQYAHQWQLKATPAQLWPHVSNTERLNKAVGLPSVRYEVKQDDKLGFRRYAHAKVIGFQMTWEEHPFEWVEGQRMGILREFAKGPFKWMLSTVELAARPEGGTTLTHTLTVEPRGFLGRLIAPMNLGRSAKKGLQQVYQRIDEVCTNTANQNIINDEFEQPTRLSRHHQRSLDARIEQLRAFDLDREVVEILAIYVANAPDQDVARVKPLAIANRFGLPEMATVEACLRGVTVGLFDLQWDVICPLCRIPSGHRDTLKELREHENCPTCAIDFQPDFANAIELVFRVNADVRPVRVGHYCAGGPAHSPHVVAQIRVEPGEIISLDLALSEGVYRLRGPQLPWTAELRVTAEAITTNWDIHLDQSKPAAISPLVIGRQELTCRNTSDRPLTIRIERTVERDDVLTAAKAMTTPMFRTLFPGEILSPGQLASASKVTLLQLHIQDFGLIENRLGEQQTFQLLQSFYRAVESQIKMGQGSIVKLIDDGLLAAFSRVSDAVQTAFALDTMLSRSDEFTAIKIGMGIHRGMAMVATLNDRLDYFGQTPKITARLTQLARGNEFVVSASTTHDHDVHELCQHQPLRLVELFHEKAKPILAYVVTLTPKKM